MYGEVAKHTWRTCQCHGQRSNRNRHPQMQWLPWRGYPSSTQILHSGSNNGSDRLRRCSYSTGGTSWAVAVVVVEMGHQRVSTCPPTILVPCGKPSTVPR